MDVRLGDVRNREAMLLSRRHVLFEVDRIHGYERPAVDEHLQPPRELAAVHSHRPGKLSGSDRFAVHREGGIDDRERVLASPGFDARRALAARDLDPDLLAPDGEACEKNDDRRGRTHRAQRAAADDAKQIQRRLVRQRLMTCR